MAEKHKSKYKAPKDLEKSQKPKTRKDLKDYTADDKNGGLNPNSTKEKHLNVLRKTDKEMQDDGKMYPTYNADDRLYKDIEDGNYDPKTAAKRLKKRQDDEEKDVKDVLKDKIENLTREQKERLVREYVRRKIEKILLEQPTTEEPPAEETPIEEPAAEEPAAGAAAAGTAAATATTPEPTPAAATTKSTEEPGPEERQTLNVSKIKDVLSAERSNLSRIETLFKGINQTFEDADPIDIKNFYRLMLRTIAKNYKKITEPKETE